MSQCHLAAVVMDYPRIYKSMLPGDYPVTFILPIANTVQAP